MRERNGKRIDFECMNRELDCRRCRYGMYGAAIGQRRPNRNEAASRDWSMVASILARQS